MCLSMWFYLIICRVLLMCAVSASQKGKPKLILMEESMLKSSILTLLTRYPFDFRWLNEKYSSIRKYFI